MAAILELRIVADERDGCFDDVQRGQDVPCLRCLEVQDKRKMDNRKRKPRISGAEDENRVVDLEGVF